MFEFMDARGSDQGPTPFSSFYWAVYDVIFIIIGSGVLVNMVIGVICLNYTLVVNEFRSKTITQNQKQ